MIALLQSQLLSICKSMNTQLKPGPTSEECKKMADTFAQVYPNFCYIVTSDRSNSSGYNGHKLVDYGGLRIYKLTKYDQLPNVSNDQLKQKCFVWVYDSKSNKKAADRRDLLKQKLGEKFVGYNVWLAVGQDVFPWSIRNAKAWCEFKKEQYGHNILVVLS